MDGTKYVSLALPSEATPSERRGFTRLCTQLASTEFDPMTPPDHETHLASLGLNNLYNQPRLAAAAHTLMDLADQGWRVHATEQGPLLSAPHVHQDRATEKARIRRQEHVRRDEQLGQPSVRRFIDRMERSHQHHGRLVSIFDLMRDGAELDETLKARPGDANVIRPYVQIADSDTTCELTGFKLHDIWRYFRHTWSNAYSTVPGRSMPILIRDAATRHHTVIGLAALSSPIVQIAERDSWIGWDTKQFVATIEAEPTDDAARWLSHRIETQRSEIYVDDLIRDRILQPSDLKHPTDEAIALLRADAKRHRAVHHASRTIRPVRGDVDDPWVERAQTPLFRSKRATLLAETLEIQRHLGESLGPRPDAEDLRRALADPKIKTQVGRVVRRARGERVGTVIADLTVCGAVAPYNALAAGKLVGALAVSPPVIAAYRAKYSRPSEIASAMAGRPIIREARLAFVGTTSLYGTGSSQYNRLFWPAYVMGGLGGQRMGFFALGRSRSFGTSHFSDATVEALVRLSGLSGSTVRVNSLFGEGVSPRLRKVRLGLAALGWPADQLLKHGRERILYGVPLVENIRDYALGIDDEPKYLFDPRDDGATVAQWWMERWGGRRAAKEHVQEDMSRHRLIRPITHGARVQLPSSDEMPQSAPHASVRGEP